MPNYYADCPKCDSEFEFKVTLDRCCGNVLETELVKQYCDCPVTADDMDALEAKAADKYDLADEVDEECFV